VIRGKRVEKEKNIAHLRVVQDQKVNQARAVRSRRMTRNFLKKNQTEAEEEREKKIKNRNKIIFKNEDDERN